MVINNIFFMLVVLAPFGVVDAVCQKCERIRSENAEKAKDQDWVFYEDWLNKDTESAQADKPVEKSESKSQD